MSSEWREPTDEQQAAIDLAHREFCKLANRLSRAGADRRVLLHAMAFTCADLLTSQFDASAVPEWFATMGLQFEARITRAVH